MSATGDRSVPSPEHITHRPRWESLALGSLSSFQRTTYLPAAASTTKVIFQERQENRVRCPSLIYMFAHTSVQSGEDERERHGAAHKHTALPCWCLAHLGALHQKLLPLPRCRSLLPATGTCQSPPLRTGACFHLPRLHSFLSLEVLGLPGYPQQTNTSVISGLRSLSACELLVSSQSPDTFLCDLGLPDPHY